MECPLPTKYSFPRALKEVAPEMVVFQGNHVLCMYKNLVIKLIYMFTKLYISPFCKKVYLKEYVCKDIPPHFLWKHSPKHYFTKARFPT